MSTDATIDEGEAIGAPAEIRRTASELLPLLYSDLRRLARGERYRVRAGETLQTTALIHEAYLKLHGTSGFNDRAHFLRSAALAMRHILINHARDRIAAKRGGTALKVPLDLAGEIAEPSDETLVEVNEALLRLAAVSPRLAQIVECRYFAGFGDAETAQALELTDRTVRRDWVKARAWLRRELGREPAPTALDDDGTA
jgi:RNA polymerase sigma factor (TIGR02999 family)